VKPFWFAQEFNSEWTYCFIWVEDQRKLWFISDLISPSKPTELARDIVGLSQLQRRYPHRNFKKFSSLEDLFRRVSMTEQLAQNLLQFFI
jgi:hypothetical protein